MKISKKTHAVIDILHGTLKSRKILSVINRFINPGKCNVLDIGTGSGVIASLISKKTKSLVSVDITNERIINEGYEFVKCRDARLPFPDNHFDLVISNHVIEHITNQQQHIAEIRRVLKKGGYCYLATPNRWWIMETHFRLPFLSWFPSYIANFLTRSILGREYDIYPLSWNSLRRLCIGLEVKNAAALIIKHPSSYNLDIMPFLQIIAQLLPSRIIRMFVFLYPTFILMLKKRER